MRKIARAAVLLVLVPTPLVAVALLERDARACGSAIRLEPTPKRPAMVQEIAKLRMQSGDLAGADAAIERCEEMSKDSAICRAPLPSSPVGGKA